MKDRIREVREHFGLSMEKFGSRIGIGKASISLLESGKNNPSVQTITLICREFGVNEQWLRTGEGEMFEQTRASVLDRLSAEYDLSREQRSVIEAFLDLDPQERDVILKYVHNVFDRSAESAAQSTAIPDKEAQRIAESDEFKTLREKNEPPESESCTTAG
jgi:transcriptional regulator with XRE-family HTH domain